jgi:hypothetical protein
LRWGWIALAAASVVVYMRAVFLSIKLVRLDDLSEKEQDEARHDDAMGDVDVMDDPEDNGNGDEKHETEEN